MSNKNSISNFIIFLLLAAVSFVVPEYAFANPWTSGATSLKSDASTVLQTISAIAVMGSGALYMFGKIQKQTMVGIMIGAVLIFGADQVISWIRSGSGI